MFNLFKLWTDLTCAKSCHWPLGWECDRHTTLPLLDGGTGDIDGTKFTELPKNRVRRKVDSTGAEFSRLG